MGRTNETATQLIRFHQHELAKFFSALRKSDQIAFEDLFALAQFHIAPLAFSGTAEPQTIIYFAMLLEQHKLILIMQKAIKFLLEQQGIESDQWLDL
jgi:tRNA isopentenyl-2-thiomethyl-A-37 hydroxylase MiaE